MGKYDLDSVYDESQIYTLNELIYEVKDESPLLLTYRDILYKFYNNRKSGVLDKLGSLFNHDLISQIQESNECTFEILKLAKKIYFIDKEPKIKGNKTSWCKNYVFLDMLKKPRLANFHTTLPGMSVHDDMFEDVRKSIYNVISNSEELYKKMFQISCDWRRLLQNLSIYVLDDFSSSQLEIVSKELDRIEMVLNKNIYSKIHPFVNVTKENFLKTFFNILNSHTFLCSFHDNIETNNSLDIPPRQSKEYIAEFKKLDNIVTSWEILDLSKNYLKKIEHHPCAEMIFKLSINSDYITDKKLNDYEYALEHAKLVSDWFRNYLDSKYDLEINVIYLISIIQEIIYLKENEKVRYVKNDYFGYNNMYKSLLSALSNSTEANPIVILAWQKRIENRIITNLGRSDLLEKKRKIENIIYRICEYIFSFHHLEDIEVVNDFLFEKISIISLDNFTAMKIGQLFLNKISEKVVDKNYTIDISLNSKNMFTFFKLISLYKIDNVAIVIDYFAKVINEADNLNNDKIVLSPIFNPIGYVSEIKFILSYKINAKEKYLHFLEFKEIYDDKKVELLSKLGLKDFFEEN